MCATRIKIIIIFTLFCKICGVPTPSYVDYPEYSTSEENWTEENISGPPLVPGLKVSGGQKAVPGDFPHQVYISHRKNKNEHMCSASIIHKRLLLTAAHCVLDLSPEDIEVVTGEYDLSKIEGTEQRHHVASINIHEKYNRSSKMNDIAILVLQSAIKLDHFTKVINIAKPNQTLPRWATVSGWGSTGDGRTSNILQRAYIKILSIEVCRSVFTRETVTDDMICAGTKDRRDTCAGDSGGPMTCGSTGGQKYLCGIISWGSPCEDKHYDSPGVYTDVRKYYAWIQNHMFARRK